MVRRVEHDDEALAARDRRLRVGEAELLERERQALADDPTPGELAAFAAERDKIAGERDRIADLLDERAAARDHSALRRDVSGSGRDQRARDDWQDSDPGFPDRYSAGADRDLAAGDRSDSHDDRARGHEHRERAAADRSRAAVDRDEAARKADAHEQELRRLHAALESRHVIGQAQGLLMARHDLSSQAAFAVLVRLSQASNTKLREVARQLAAAAEPRDE